MDEMTKRPGDGFRHTAGVGTGRSAIAVVVFYILLAALNVVELHASIMRQPYGPTRTFWLAVTGPFARGSHALYLDRPRAWLRAVLGRRLNDESATSG